mgnify:CR=1 FL=1
MTGLLSNPIPFLALVLGFGFIIFIHELGHFLVAKWVGIRCTQFAIGFGHAILTYRKGLGLKSGSTEAEYERRTRRLLRDEGVDLDSLGEMSRQLRLFEAADRLGLGETEYRLNWMPLGGYVKMLGQEDMDPTAQSDDPRAFNRKPVWARAAVISAGVTMNLIFGLLFFIIAFMAGVKFPPAIVGETVPGSPAANASPVGHEDDPALVGLRPGDRVVSINGKAATDFMDIAVNTALASRDQPLDLVVERDGHARPLMYRMTPVQANQGGGKLLSIGVMPPLSLTVGKLEAGVPMHPDLEAAGIKPGFTITHVNDEPVSRYDQYAAAIESRRGQPVSVTFADGNGGSHQVTLAAQPLLTATADTPGHLLGLMPVMKVAAPMPGSRAEKAGLRGGDVFVSIDGASWPTLDQGIDLVSAAAGRSIRLVVLRDGDEVTLDDARPDSQGKLGFVASRATELPVIGGVLPGSPAATLELSPGSTVLAVNDRDVTDWGDLQRLLAEAAAASPGGGEVKLTIRRAVAGDPVATLQLPFDAEQAKALAAAGWIDPLANPLMLEDLMVPVTAASPWAATKMGVHKTHQFMLQTYMTLLRLFQQTVPVSELRGPVGIFHIGTQTAQKGWTYLLFFLGLISVNLVVINFLPIPIVDGGLMVFLIIEKLKGSPVHPKVLAAANYVGLALIGSVMLMTFYFDITRLLR